MKITIHGVELDERDLAKVYIGVPLLAAGIWVAIWIVFRLGELT